MVGKLIAARGRWTITPVMIVVAACTAPDRGVDPETGFVTELPESVRELADPSQDLTTVRLNPDDNCYWYLYSGPVETTMLPLRTRDGRWICAQPSEEG
jgi:hypothetical protein